MTDHLLAAGLAGQAAFSGGRSRHGTGAGDRSGSGVTRRAAQSAARGRRAATCSMSCSCHAGSPPASRIRRPAELLTYGNVFTREDIGGRPRLRVSVDEAEDATVAALAKGLRGPFQVHYVLHTTRTGAELGRYESPELTSENVEEFLREFGQFFCEDSRHDLWVRSHDDDATIVLDRHNLIYAHGPLELFEEH